MGGTVIKIPTTDIYNALRESLSFPIITVSAITVSSLADRKNMAFVIIVSKSNDIKHDRRWTRVNKLRWGRTTIDSHR